jgi:hemimethylated DNA binding protein
MTYVAEQNLEPDLTGDPVSHPLLDQFFTGFEGGLHQRRMKNH